MERVVDVLIIGGGPAGMSCAVTLQKAGVKNMVVEKRSFPRDKTCGGLVTAKTQRLFKEIFDISEKEALSAFVCDESESISLYNDGEPLASTPVVKPLLSVKRMDMDAFFARRYLDLGGDLNENVYPVSVDAVNRRADLSNGESVSFSRLVVADGALSATRAMLGYPKQKLGFCVEAHIPKSKLSCGDGVRIYFGVVKKGYAWVFPSGASYCVGLGGVYEKGTRYDIVFKDFLSELGVDASECRIKGAFVPYGKVIRQDRGGENVVLIGDAGGFVDPIYGEGLYFALASGLEAAKAVLSGSEKFHSEFKKRSAYITKIIRQGGVLQKIFYSSVGQRAFVKKVRGKNAFVGFYCDNQLSDYRYPYFKALKLYRDYKKSKRS